jgi:hypothetical protein
MFWEELYGSDDAVGQGRACGNGALDGRLRGGVSVCLPPPPGDLIRSVVDSGVDFRKYSSPATMSRVLQMNICWPWHVESRWCSRLCLADTS